MIRRLKTVWKNIQIAFWFLLLVIMLATFFFYLFVGFFIWFITGKDAYRWYERMLGKISNKVYE